MIAGNYHFHIIIADFHDDFCTIRRNMIGEKIMDRAGIPKVRFHDLHHTFATIALQNGVDIKTVSGMLGHFSAGFTLDTSAQKEAAQTISNILAS